MEQFASDDLVDRPALRHRLDDALSLPLTLLVAQAGAGKTVLLRQWVASHPELAFVWIDVESADDDPVRFTRRLLAGLSEVRPGMQRFSRHSALNAGGLGGSLVNTLAAELAELRTTVIVLDDLHHLANATLLADIGRLVAALPPDVHVVMSTRVDPPIAWSGLRLRNRLLEIRQADLVMTEDESAHLLATITHREVSPGTLAVLTARTEGWAAGLQLAALTLRFHRDPDGFVAEFGGTDRLVAEYLSEEVLDALPGGSRELLLRMSPLDTMSAELVDHVLDRSDGRLLLERLERESMFVLALDAHREQFRFHHLFRDLLRYRLRTEDAAEEARLLARAGEFHLDRGELAPAVEYFLRARDWDRALDAIMTRGSDVFERGEMRTVIRWITSVPEVSRAERLDVALELGILVGMQGEAARAVEIFRRVAYDPRGTVGQRVIAHVWTSATTQWNPRAADSIRAAERGLALLATSPDATIPDLIGLTTPALLTTLAVGSAGRSHFLAGDLAEADVWLMRALDTDGVAYPPFRVGVLGSLAVLRAWCGRLLEAELLAAEAFETAGSTGLLTHPVIADAYLAEALIAHERGLPDAASAPLSDGTVRADANHRTQLAWLARCQRALLAAAGRRFEEALELADLSGLPVHDDMSAPAPAILARLAAVHMNVLRRTGRSEESLRLRRAATPSTAELAFESAAASLSLGDRDGARRVIARSSAAFESEGPRGDIRRLQLLAWSAELVGDHRAALELVDTALGRAEPEGLVEVFLDTDDLVLDLVAELAPARGGLADAIRERRRRLVPPDANGVLPEPLTGRELEILSYLPGHSTSAELAKLCFVSTNTLKTHMAHIYRKLGVSGRSAAIARARELGLLTPTVPAQRAHA